MRIKLTGETSEQDRYLAVAAKVVELAVLDAIKNPLKISDEDERSKVAQRASEAIGWMNTGRYNDYCDMVGISPVRIRRGVHEFNAKKKSLGSPTNGGYEDEK